MIDQNLQQRLVEKLATVVSAAQAAQAAVHGGHFGEPADYNRALAQIDDAARLLDECKAALNAEISAGRAP